MHTGITTRASTSKHDAKRARVLLMLRLQPLLLALPLCEQGASPPGGGLRPPLPPSRAALRASPSLLLLLLLLLLRVRAPSRCPVQVPLGGCACGSSTALMAAAGPASAEEGFHGQHH
jgi:hypothetical protein